VEPFQRELDLVQVHLRHVPGVETREARSAVLTVAQLEGSPQEVARGIDREQPPDLREPVYVVSVSFSLVSGLPAVKVRDSRPSLDFFRDC